MASIEGTSRSEKEFEVPSLVYVVRLNAVTASRLKDELATNAIGAVTVITAGDCAKRFTTLILAANARLALQLLLDDAASSLLTVVCQAAAHVGIIGIKLTTCV